LEICIIAPIRIGRNASNLQKSWDVEVVSKLQWGMWCIVGDTIDSIPLLAIDIRARVCEHDGSTQFDQSTVV